jgi:hypothetical protein
LAGVRLVYHFPDAAVKETADKLLLRFGYKSLTQGAISGMDILMVRLVGYSIHLYS